MILRVRVIGSSFVSNAANLQTIDFAHHFQAFSPLFHLCRALAETGFILEFCLKLFESNCTSLFCLKTHKNVIIYFSLYSFSTHLMERTSLGQKALKGGTTLNQPPIGLHVKILHFKISTVAV